MEQQRQQLTQQNNKNDIQFFAKQKKIYPKRVAGRFRDLKWLAMVVTLGIYYLVPFIRWDRGPNAPNQAVLIDLSNQKAYWFFIEIWPQEVYILTGILILSAIMLFFVTSLFGRVWCGYLCPQTVWTDLYMFVERIFQGDRNARMKLHDGPWSFNKIWRLAATHLMWIVIAWSTAGSFVLYFNDAPTLVRSFFEFNVSNTVLAFIVGLTSSTYLMAGFAREQVCTYMCPYARFQSAMFDENTLIIGYDTVRGEPRGKHKKGEGWEGRGHCIDCTACVQVCPMGIDIRDGLQMECIACGLCIDACDEVMTKLELPKGLIRYDTTRHMALKQKGIFEKFRIIRPRTIFYMTVISMIGVVMLSALVFRAKVQLNVLHDRNPLFVQLSDGGLRNGYEIKILNKTYNDIVYQLEVLGIEKASLEVRAAGDASASHLPVKAGQVGHFHVFLTAPAQENDKQTIEFLLKSDSIDAQAKTESVFVSRESR
jgi:cytochrome c oxidase accessory protein FixG